MIAAQQNTAEPALRPAVIWRRLSFGSQSKAGSQFVARLLTVITTLKVQGRDVIEFLSQACKAARLGEPMPSLLPQGSPLEGLLFRNDECRTDSSLAIIETLVQSPIAVDVVEFPKPNNTKAISVKQNTRWLRLRSASLHKYLLASTPLSQLAP